MDVRVVWTLEDWAGAVVDLTVSSSLPERVVLVPHARAAQALQRALLARGAQAVLVGTRFSTALELASELLRDAGRPLVANERALGPLLVRDALFGLELEHFDPDALLEKPGADAVLARAVGELEAARLGPGELCASAEPRVRDLGHILGALQASATLITPGAIFTRAATAACATARHEALLALVTGDESVAELDFLRALPRASFVLWATQSMDARRAARLAPLLGAARATPLPPRARRRSVKRAAARDGSPHDAAGAGDHALRVASAQRAPARALAALQARLGAGHEQGAHANAIGEDESVTITEHESVREEVDAALAWVAEQVRAHGLALHEIALLAPTLEPYGRLLRARMATVPGDGASSLLSFEGGVPLAEREDGKRLSLVLRALGRGLARDALAPLLPILRSRLESRAVRDLPHAQALLETVAVGGGDAADLRGGRVWPEAWESAILRLEGEPSARGDRAAKRALVEELAGLAPAIDALTDVLRHILIDAPLSIVWMCVSSFARAHLELPGKRPLLWPLMDEALEVFVGHEEQEPTGADALAWLEQTLRTLRVDGGEEHVGAYFGSFRSARGTSFRAVRLLGLSAPGLVADVGEDGLLTDARREALGGGLPTSRERTKARLAALESAVHVARERLAWSVPRKRRESPEHGADPCHPLAVLSARARRADLGAIDLERSLQELAAGMQRPRSSPPRSSQPAAATGEVRDARFAATVRRALALLLTKRAGNADGATRSAARACGLEHAIETATEDVRRTFDALQEAGLPAHPLRAAYAVAGALAPHRLDAGSIDLVVERPAELLLIGFVIAPPPRSSRDLDDREQARALRRCAALLRASGTVGERELRTALVHTADGALRFVDEATRAPARA